MAISILASIIRSSGDGWSDLPSMNFLLEKQFSLYCGQSLIKQEYQMDESAKHLKKEKGICSFL